MENKKYKNEINSINRCAKYSPPYDSDVMIFAGLAKESNHGKDEAIIQLAEINENAHERIFQELVSIISEAYARCTRINDPVVIHIWKQNVFGEYMLHSSRNVSQMETWIERQKIDLLAFRFEFAIRTIRPHPRIRDGAAIAINAGKTGLILWRLENWIH